MAILILLPLSGIVAQDSTPEPKAIWQPAPGTTWQWQIAGTLNTTYDVAMYDVDLFDTSPDVIADLHGRGIIVICYFSAGTFEDWRPDVADFPETVLGDPLEDWEGERYLDVRQLDILQPIMTARLDLAVEQGCDGVEPDNVDAYTNPSGFPLTYADQPYNLWLAEAAHERGLSVGLKNDLDQIPDLVAQFDWALDEQCFQYEECDLRCRSSRRAKQSLASSTSLIPKPIVAPRWTIISLGCTKLTDLDDEPPNDCRDLAKADE